MYEITLNPEDYGIEALVEGMGGKQIAFAENERKQWAVEVETFARRLDGLSSKARQLQAMLAGKDAIKATPASLKTLKVQLFNINDALTASIEMAEKLESEIVSL